MRILLYFDWSATRKELKEWEDKIKVACDETKVTYMGLHGSMNEKWNYVGMFETDSFDEFQVMARKVPRPKYMTHHITEILMQINLG
ncbi:MAG TPA: hypothetical protein VM050_11235 [Patescibacteria group bacterium]|nr:hypothetical protein [Patescibacteria group bacterium]